MKTIILCGGRGTRFSEETVIRPKPMVNIGGHPLLWHIMNHYSHYGFNEFVLALGHRGNAIKEYFLNYHALNSDFKVDLSTGKIDFLKLNSCPWKVELIDTGDEVMTGGRVKRLEPLLKSNGTFLMTYGDGVADIDLHALLQFHKSHGRLVTVTGVHPLARFGGLHIENQRVIQFQEKPQAEGGWINGGFFVMEPGVFDYLDNDHTILEQEPLMRLANDGQLMAYQHHGFWHCMDTVRDRQKLEELWNAGLAPWKIW